jgi:hypothetical protein
MQRHRVARAVFQIHRQPEQRAMAHAAQQLVRRQFRRERLAREFRVHVPEPRPPSRNDSSPVAELKY